MFVCVFLEGVEENGGLVYEKERVEMIEMQCIYVRNSQKLNKSLI